MSKSNDIAEALFEALEGGDPEQTKTLALRLIGLSRDPEHRLLAATGLLEAGESGPALRVLEDLPRVTLEPEQAELRALRIAECRYALGDPETALSLLESVPVRGDQDEADRLWWLGLCHDHLGDRVQADISFREASRLDPVGLPPPATISPDEAAALVEGVIGCLPEVVRRAIAEVQVVIDDLPPLALVRSSGGSVHPDILGLYSGQDLTERSHLDPGGLPSMIHIFRRNLERIAFDRRELEEEIRITLLHEVGHHLGLDEEDVDRLGLG